MSETSTKPYLLRALYEWCTDNGYTPYIVVMVDGSTRVPMEFVKNGEIVLNISFDATGHLKIDNDFIHFKARFGGISREIEVPVQNVSAIYARENGQGMAFEVTRDDETTAKKKTSLKSPDASNQRAETAPGLTAVPASEAPVTSGATPDDETDPPKKGGPPRLTRIK
jgi:stringent starvation protein B